MNRGWGVLVAAAVLVGGVGTAEAKMVREAPSRDVHAGVNLRTDFGTRQVRFDLGAKFGAMDYRLVLDPMGLTDDRYDVDAIVHRSIAGDRWGVFLGGRTTAINLDFGHQYHGTALVGITGRLPKIDLLSHVRGEFGLEAAATFVRFGGDLPTNFIGWGTRRAFSDLVNMSLFVRFEWAQGI